MRHHKSGRKLNRNSSHREAMFKNMAASLFRYEQITTTLPKAKELRRVAEPLITLAKVSSVANRRLAFSRLRDREVVTKLFDILGLRYKDRPGGYLRILKFGFRAGDTAPMALVQLVDRPEVVEGAEPASEKPQAAKKVKTPKVKADKGTDTGTSGEDKSERRAKKVKKEESEGEVTGANEKKAKVVKPKAAAKPKAKPKASPKKGKAK